MVTGYTTTEALSHSINLLVTSARIVREQKGGMPKLVDVKDLSEGKGTTWKEVSYGQLMAYAITETTEEDNPQQMSDTPLEITPTMVSVHTVILDRVARVLDKKAFAETAVLSQNAIDRKEDEDGLVVLDGASVSLGGAGVTLTSGHIRAAQRRISSNTTEPEPDGPYYTVLHGFQIKPLEDELTAGVGTYNVPVGLTQDVYAKGFQGKLGSTQVHENGNITIDAAGDAKGGVFSKKGIVLVRGKGPWIETKREPQIGGGATAVFHRSEYAYGERSPGNWVVEIYSDATAPTT